LAMVLDILSKIFEKNIKDIPRTSIEVRT